MNRKIRRKNARTKKAPSNLMIWAQRELDILANDGGKDGLQEMMNRDIMEMLEVFSAQGHTGLSASYAIAALVRLMNWKPLSPLTGADDEWIECSEGLEQNKRYSAVFRDKGDNATAYYIHGKIFSPDGGLSWCEMKDSSIPVVFPFTVPERPEQVYIKWINEDEGTYEVLTDTEEIKALYEQKKKEYEEANKKANETQEGE